MSARDLIVRSLEAPGGRDLKAARASCRALRQLVDGSLCDVRVKVSRGDMELCNTGAYFPLRRWPRCSGLTVELRDKHQLAGDPILPDVLLSLPFVGFPPEARQRIRTLRIDGWYSVQLPGTALSALLLRLPALQCVSINGGMPDEPYQQQLMYDALASLPYLEELELPVCHALDGLGGLAGSKRLRKLSLKGSVMLHERDAALVAGITSLAHLQELSMCIDETPSDIIIMLLHHLPPAMRKLALQDSDVPSSDSVLYIEHGRVMAVHFKDWCRVDQFMRFMDKVLQPSGVLGQRLRRVRLQEVILDSPEEQQLEPAAVSRVRELLHDRCDEVEVGRMRVGRYVRPQHALTVMDVLGTVPRQLYLNTKYGRFTVQLRPQPPEQDPPPPPQANSSSAFPQAAAAPEGAAPPQLPPPPSLMELVVQALVGGVPVEAGQATMAGVETAMGHPDNSSSDSSMQQYEPRLLLLHGPAVAALAWAPKALRGWMEELEERMQVEAPQGDGGAGGGTARRLVGHLALPGSPAVLVRCSSAKAAAAVAGAARAAAADAQKAAGGGGADRQLRVLRVVKAPVTWPEGANVVFQLAVEQAAQQLYDSGRGNRRRRLQWLLEGWENVRELDLGGVVW